jgi:hypothetical protein
MVVIALMITMETFVKIVILILVQSFNTREIYAKLREITRNYALLRVITHKFLVKISQIDS